MGAKLPMISLDLPEDVAAWNTRHTPDGWQLVPTKADMRIEGAIALSRNLKASEIWEDALSAAPSPGQEE